MWDSIQTYEPIIRLISFLGIFSIIALWEVMAPCRKLEYSRLVRWPNNIGIAVINTIVLRIVFPIAAVGIALAAEAKGWGVFNTFSFPTWLAIILSVVILDFAIYLQHILVHAVPALWRLHRMHHTDLDFDVTTGARFHPVEIMVSMGLKLMVVGALGTPAIAVLLFEVLLNATAMFNHGNIRVHRKIDRLLRMVIVTPDMHRVHHSILPQETNSNFGFNLPWWDYLFGTYKAQPKDGHEHMIIGIEQFRERSYLRLDWMLIQPCLDKPGNYPINRTVSGKSQPTNE